MSRLIIKQDISKIRNQILKGENTRFVVANVLDKLNDEKYGSEDAYTKAEVNALLAGQMTGDYVPLAGTIPNKPVTGSISGVSREGQNVTGNFLLGKDDGYMKFSLNNSSILGNFEYGINSGNNTSLITNSVSRRNRTTNQLYSSIMSVSYDRSYISTSIGVDSTTFNVAPYSVSMEFTNSSTAQFISYLIDDKGIYTNNYLPPQDDTYFVQKKYVDEAIAGNVPTGFIPLTGSSSITGQLIATSYFIPSNNNAFVQKKYVDDSIAAIPAPTGFIPLTGASNITGALAATSYFTPSNANNFVQKKYVDDSIAAIPAPTGFIPLAGSVSITGALVATSYIAPTNNNAFVQKKYVDDAVAGNVPTGFIPLAGAANITGELAATTYLTPSGLNSFVQKKYVDDSIAAIPAPTGFIPLAGSTAITGQLRATTYITPASANNFVQKKYVDDSIAAIPAPTGFIPLAGSASITGALSATTYFTPSNNNAFVQKKYVDDSVNAFTDSFIPSSGTPNNIPVSERLEAYVSGDNFVRIGTPNPDTTNGNYGISSAVLQGTIKNQFDFSINGMNYYSEDSSNGNTASVKSVVAHGATLSSKEFRGSSQVIVYSNNVTVGVKMSGDSSYTNVIYDVAQVYSSKVYQYTGMSDEAFIQKAHIKEFHSLDTSERKTGGLFKKDGVADVEIYSIVVSKVISIAGGLTYDIDISSIGAREMVDVRGKVYINSSNSETVLNSYHQQSGVTETILNGSGRPVTIRFRGNGDAFDGTVYLYLYYTK